MSTLRMAAQALLARRAEIAAALRAIVPGEGVIDSADGAACLRVRRTTAYRASRRWSRCCPTSGAGVEVLAYCHAHSIRGGAARPPAPRCRAARCRSPTACCSGARQIQANPRDPFRITACVVTEPGVTNLAIRRRGGPCRLLLRARSISQIACSIGGETPRRTSGGAHCLRRHDHQQLLGLRNRADDRRDPGIGGNYRNAATIRWGSSPAPRGCSASSPISPRESCRSRRQPARRWSALRRSRLLANARLAIIGAGIIPGGMDMMAEPAHPRRRSLRSCRRSARRSRRS